MNIEIKITADSVEEMQEALHALGRKPAITVSATTSAPVIAQGGELTLPAGTDLKVAAVSRNDVTLVSDPTVEPMKAPEKPKRARKAAKPAESAQESAGEQEAPQPEQVTPEPEPAAEAPVGAPSEPAPTLDRIAAAGAKLLDDNPNAMTPLLDLLKDYDVQAITQLKADQLAGFAARLRELGAEV